MRSAFVWVAVAVLLGNHPCATVKAASEPLPLRPPVAGATQQHQRNREFLDQPLRRSAELLRVADMQRRLGKLAESIETYTELVEAYSTSPAAREAHIALGEELSKRGNWAPAPDHILSALEVAGDRGPTHQAREARNQAYLDAVTTPLSAEHLSSLLGMWAKVCDALLETEGGREPQIQSLVARWEAANAASYGTASAALWSGQGAEPALAAAWSRNAGPDHPPGTTCGREQWLDLCASCDGTCHAGLAAYTFAQWLHWRGFYAEAEDFYHRARAEPVLPALAARTEFALAELSRSTGRLKEAAKRFETAASGLPRWLSERARLGQAECLELLGDPAGAGALLAGLAENAGSWELRSQAALAVERCRSPSHDLAGLASSSGGPVWYLGEDRQTQGEWQFLSYGAAVLAAQSGPIDVCCGPLWPVQCRVHTGDPDQPAQWWSQSEDDYPSNYFNPVARTYRMANWDDKGESVSVGHGPDLVLDIQIPDGVFYLLLYFVNDHNYYEPSRRYTVYVENTSGEVLAGCSVRECLNGVYQRFGVVGPLDLRVHVWRNASMNTILSGAFVLPAGSRPPLPAPLSGSSTAELAHVEEEIEAWLGLSRSSPGDWFTDRERRTTLLSALEAAARASEQARGQAYARAWAMAAATAETGVVQAERLLALVEAMAARSVDDDRLPALESLAEALFEEQFVKQAQIVDEFALTFCTEHAPTVILLETAKRVAERHYRDIPYYFGTLDGRAANPTYAVRTYRRLLAEYVARRSPSLARLRLLELAGRYYEEGKLEFAGLTYRALEAYGLAGELAAGDLYRYARTITDDLDMRAALLARLSREPGGALPAHRGVILSGLLDTHLARNDAKAAEEVLGRLMELADAPGDLVCLGMYSLATHYYAKDNRLRCAHWLESLGERCPGSPVADQSRKLLAEMEEGAGPQ